MLRALNFQRTGCLCALWALAGSVPLAPSAESAPFAFRSGVVIDPVGSVMYAQDPDGRVTCIDLRDGANCWRANDECKPLAVLNGVLWAQDCTNDGAVLSVVGFDVSNRGDSTGNAASVGAVSAGAVPPIVARLAARLPDGVRVLLHDRPYQRFHITAVRVGGACFLTWDYQELAQSRPLSPEAASSGWRAEGILRLAPAPAGRPVSAATLTAVDEEELLLAQRVDQPAGLSAALDAHRANPPALHADHVWAAVERSSQGAHEVATLKRWRATDGVALPDVMIAESPATYRYPSADRSHLLVSAPAGAGRYTWRICDVTTGQTIVKMEQDRVGAWFCLLGNLLLVESFAATEDVTESSLWIRAIDTDTGAQRWQYEIRDLAFRGAFPPVRPSDASLSPPP